MIKYFCDCCGKEMFEPIDYVDMKITKCHMLEYDTEFVHCMICPGCRKKILGETDEDS